MKILITGASGFIGSFIVEEALAHGFETWAAVRPTSSRRYLQDSRIHFINLDFSSEAKLIESLRNHKFDYVVHAAGVTKIPDSEILSFDEGSIHPCEFEQTESFQIFRLFLNQKEKVLHQLLEEQDETT